MRFFQVKIAPNKLQATMKIYTRYYIGSRKIKRNQYFHD